MRLGTYYRSQLLKNLGLFSKIKKKDKILDIGGFDGYILSKINAKSKTLIDINIDKKFKRIKYLKNDFFKEKFSNNKFDYIFSFDVLEHLPKEREQEYFKKINDLLKIGGIAYITIPSKHIKLFPNFLTKWVSKKWGHHKCLGYTREELRAFIKQTNMKYEIIELNARAYLNNYLFIRFLQIFLPMKMTKRFIVNIAKYDSKHLAGERGYFFIKMRKVK